MKEKLPSAANIVATDYPEVWRHYAELGAQLSQAGPLRGETRRLVKLALAIGFNSEGAVHSHVRRGRAEGISRDAMRHVALLATTTGGFPAAVRAMTWIDDIYGKPARRTRKG
jgi:alkylhydroperoxidase/carboxymuconolactone decarboxylase family protein YurZ